VRFVRWGITCLLTLNAIVFVALVGLRLCARWRVDRVEQFVIQRSTPKEFATRSVMVVSGPKMVGIEVSRFETTHVSDVQLFGFAYARQPKWLWSRAPISPDPFAGWNLATPIPGCDWLRPIGVQYDDAAVPWSRHASRHTVRVGLNWWLLLSLSGIVPIVWGLKRLGRWRRRRKWRRAGCCVECGHDLRATPGQCPECGAQRNGLSI
jgi:hypothetical protein